MSIKWVLCRHLVSTRCRETMPKGLYERNGLEACPELRVYSDAPAGCAQSAHAVGHDVSVLCLAENGDGSRSPLAVCSSCAYAAVGTMG